MLQLFLHIGVQIHLPSPISEGYSRKSNNAVQHGMEFALARGFIFSWSLARGNPEKECFSRKLGYSVYTI